MNSNFPVKLKNEEKSDQLVTRKESLAWIFYTFGLEVISAVAMSVFIPLCLNTMAKLAGKTSDGLPCDHFADCWVELGSLKFQPTSFTYYIISISVAFQAITFISIGALADYGKARKGMLIGTTVGGGIVACLFLTAVSAGKEMGIPQFSFLIGRFILVGWYLHNCFECFVWLCYSLS